MRLLLVPICALILLAAPARPRAEPAPTPPGGRDLATTAASQPSPEPTRARLTGGASSIDELIDRFVAALASGDRDRVEGLRVTETEYRSILIPGSVKPGEPPQVLSEDGLEYFWAEMSQKSAAYREAILARFGKRALTPVRHSFEKGEREFAGYKAYQRLVLVLRDDQGAEHELRTGSIVERDGVFKFASFIRD
jgi:hypothetical protein